MKLAHLSDLHLGFRAYSRSERGWNQRERDHARAYRSALQAVAKLRPDLVLITGDVFDRPDPPTTAFLTFSRGVSRLRAHLPGVPILVIAGERDSPANEADPGPVAVLDSIPGVEAVAGAARAVRFRAAGVHALLVPSRAVAGAPFPEVKPDPASKWNVLLVRGDPTRPGPGISVDPERWSYVAVGGPHGARQWGPNIWTPGSLERPLLSPWKEATEEKGFVTFDLATAEAEFHPVPGRAVVDLAPVRVTPGDVEAGTRRLRDLLQGVPGGVGDKILRVRLRGDVVSPYEGVSAGLLDAVRRKAAHLEVHLQYDWTDAAPVAEPTSWTASEVSVPGRSDGPFTIPLEDPGITLVTARFEELRAELADPESTRGFEVRPPPPDEVSRQLWSGGSDPVALCRLVVGELSRPRVDRDRLDPHGPHAASDVGADLSSVETHLADLRADAVEASGDLEAATMEWARERQDADSKLEFYRERARELRRRIRQLEGEGERAPCPTCGKPLGGGFAGLVERLRAEWEGLIHDGKWWRRRREQLEEKPDELRRMEEHALRLHARVEEAAEAVERLRRSEPASGYLVAEPGRIRAGGEDIASAYELDASRDRALREVLRTAGNLLARITQGRVLGVGLFGGRFHVVGGGGTTRLPIGAEAAALRLAVRLALWRYARSRRMHVGALLIRELYADGAGDLAVGALDVLSEVRRFDAAVVFVGPPSLRDRVPEAFREVLELSVGAEGRPEFRRSGSGRPSLSGLGLATGRV